MELLAAKDQNKTKRRRNKDVHLLGGPKHNSSIFFQRVLLTQVATKKQTDAPLTYKLVFTILACLQAST